MKEKLKNFVIPFLLMIILNLGTNILIHNHNFSGEINPHYGILFISGLFFGPYGALGSAIGNFICDLVNGYNNHLAILYLFLDFGIGLLAYKLWFAKFQEYNVTKIRINNTLNLLHYFLIVTICGFLFGLISTIIIALTYPNTLGYDDVMGLRFFINFINFSLIFSVLGIWISRIKDFTVTPKKSKRQYDSRLYKILGYVLSIYSLIVLVLNVYKTLPLPVYAVELVIFLILIFAYTTKPIKKISYINYISLPEKVIDRFLLTTLIIILISSTIIFFIPYEILFISFISLVSENHISLLILLIIDVMVIIFFIPTYFIIKYIESRIVNPITLFSKIESRIKKDERIESEDLINVYSKFSNQEDEIGMLSRSYIDLINYNNDYIDNIKKTESEKQRIKTELSIAHTIQESILPKHPIDNEYYYITGCCKPAKEVGGDFFDYYEVDEDNLVIVIGDASGKGIPAALFTILTQNSIKQLLRHEHDPSEVLIDINNQMCDNNPEVMFITLWLGIYNKKSHKLTFSNAGHNPPFIKNKDEYIILQMDSEIVLGVMEDYQFSSNEITIDGDLFIYTDGITDAQNNSHELYGEERLINFLNKNERKDNIIKDLFDNIQDYIEDEEQFDDMTVLYLNVKK